MAVRAAAKSEERMNEVRRIRIGQVPVVILFWRFTEFSRIRLRVLLQRVVGKFLGEGFEAVVHVEE